MGANSETYFVQDEFNSTAGGQTITFDRHTKIDVKNETDTFDKSQIDIMMGTINAKPLVKDLVSGETRVNERLGTPP